MTLKKERKKIIKSIIARTLFTKGREGERKEVYEHMYIR